MNRIFKINIQLRIETANWRPLSLRNPLAEITKRKLRLLLGGVSWYRILEKSVFFLHILCLHL